jgi:Lar family restriction alleviation protein
MAELKPCPFCGGKAAFVPRAVNIALQKDPSDPKFGVSVICSKCGAESPNMIDEEHAAAKWNARTDGVQEVWTPQELAAAKERANEYAGWFLTNAPGVRVTSIVQCPGCGEGVADGMPCRRKRGHVRPPDCKASPPREGDPDAYGVALPDGGQS